MTVLVLYKLNFTLYKVINSVLIEGGKSLLGETPCLLMFVLNPSLKNT